MIIASTLCSAAGCQTLRHVETTVINEDGQPIEDVKVDVRYLGNDHWEKETDTGFTDKNGTCVAD